MNPVEVDRMRRALLPVTLPLSWLYGAAVRIRNRSYEDESRVQKLSVGVVSVGNLTVGGSGKTPLVAAVAREIRARGVPVAVVSRGYGRPDTSSFVLVSDGKDVLAPVTEAGDEPLELAQRLPGVAVAVGADRFRTGQRLIEAAGSRALVLDDGFQHRGLHRDLDLVCFDAREPEAGLRLLPAGRLREPLTSLRRADAVIWTDCSEDAPSEALEERVLRAAGGEVPILRARTRVVDLAPIGPGVVKEALPPDALQDEPAALLAAVARPERLLTTVSSPLVARHFAADHHWWRSDEVRAFADEAKAKGARALLTTGKDAVKIAPLLTSGALRLRLPLYAVRIETEILDPDALRDLLDRIPGL